ncbi:MAG: hypothetical protein AABO57_10705 [Acidobacteriota bacterium]
MIRSNRQVRLIADIPAASSTKLTDTSGNPSESYHWRQMAAVRREWQHEFGSPYANTFELTIPEIISIERRVRKELYP